MFIHFAFGYLGRQEKIAEQTKMIIECILCKKRLKVSICKEFIPVFSPQGGKMIPIDKFKRTKNGLEGRIDLINFNSLPKAPEIIYLPVNVPMICFIDIAMKGLKHSSHKSYYGKFGIALEKNFLKSKGVKPVCYYSEESLKSDSLIAEWNFFSAKRNRTDEDTKRIKTLEREITLYRKPESLFSNFQKSIQVKVTKNKGRLVDVEYFTYNRYPENYNFTLEKEWRLSFNVGEDYLYFDEENVFAIITPNLEAKRDIDRYFSKYWNRKPNVIIFEE